MSDSSFKLQLLIRSELALMRIGADKAVTRSGYFAVAMLFVLLGLGMLNYSAYLALAERIHPSLAALIISSINIVIAAIAIILGRSAHSSDREELMAKEVRDMAYKELGKDVEEVKLKVESLTDEVKTISKGVSNAVGLIKLGASVLVNSKNTDKNE